MPFMVFFNSNILGVCKGFTYFYHRRLVEKDLKTGYN